MFESIFLYQVNFTRATGGSGNDGREKIILP